MKFEKTMTCSPVSNDEPWVKYETTGWGTWNYYYHNCDDDLDSPRIPTYVNAGDWSRYVSPVFGYSAKYDHE
jgi:hypothetical protein